MSKILLKAWLLSPAVLGASLVAPTAAFAELPVTEAQPSAIAAATEAPVSAETALEPTQTELKISEQVSVTPLDTLTLTPPQQLAQVPVNPHAGVGPSRGIETPANAEIPMADLDAAPQADTVTNAEVMQQLNQYGREGRGSKRQAQVTSVSQLSDVEPTAWAFQALQSLVERYGCIAGYPDGTFKGNRALTRFEFAAGVNACLERINELINASTKDLVTREDLAKLQRLMEEFAAELASLRGRVAVLEARSAELEANQFSTTTKLRGEAVFWAGEGEGNRASRNVVGQFADDSDDPTQAYLGYRARLNFDTSFTGQDLLRTRLQAQSIPTLSDYDLFNTLMARTAIDGSSNNVTLDNLTYRFPFSEGKGLVWIGAKGLALDDIQDVLTPFGDDASGAISRFGRFNPTTFQGPSGTGLGVEYAFSHSFKANVGYMADDAFASSASEGKGLFNGNYSAMAQLVFAPMSNLALSLDYNHRYFSNDNVYVTGGTGSWIANKPFGENATTTDNLGFQMNWRVARSFSIGGWFGATWADQKRGGNADATIINWAAVLGFPDLLREGDSGALIVGMPPKVTSHDISALEDEDTSIHIEGFYRFPFSEYVSITPGFYVVTNPDHNSNNDTIFVGTLRTTFRF
ncbi:iron uptake porin [Planktothrix sp. FACHB-1365]|uniref:iron uptake porin n=1 Tax=Planktothrix sp. FACHB-1365 TaxID=2692855 RepID=UPI0016820853|nr:iron uptake porin [Planktothrix sp. FACHB-1365]MBD2483093.1 iron uptake porin [Planktothrix sp. FACHB-1365]